MKMAPILSLLSFALLSMTAPSWGAVVDDAVVDDIPSEDHHHLQRDEVYNNATLSWWDPTFNLRKRRKPKPKPPSGGGGGGGGKNIRQYRAMIMVDGLGGIPNRNDLAVIPPVAVNSYNQVYTKIKDRPQRAIKFQTAKVEVTPVPRSPTRHADIMGTFSMDCGISCDRDNDDPPYMSFEALVQALNGSDGNGTYVDDTSVDLSGNPPRVANAACALLRKTGKRVYKRCRGCRIVQIRDADWDAMMAAEGTMALEE